MILQLNTIIQVFRRDKYTIHVRGLALKMRNDLDVCTRIIKLLILMSCSNSYIEYSTNGMFLYSPNCSSYQRISHPPPFRQTFILPVVLASDRGHAQIQLNLPASYRNNDYNLIRTLAVISIKIHPTSVLNTCIIYSLSFRF